MSTGMSTGTETSTAPATEPWTPERILDWNAVAVRCSLAVVLAALLVLFTVVRPGQFNTTTNLSAIVTQQGIAMLTAIALTITLTVNEFDLSLGGIVGIVAITSAWGFGEGWSPVAVVVVGLLIAFAVGAFNALLVVRFGLTSFISTLGVSMLLAGLAVMITGGAPLYKGIPAGYKAITATRILGLPALAWIILGTALVLWYLLDRTPVGRRLRATGSGRDAARLIGVRTDRYVVLALIGAALVAGIAGLLFVANNGSASSATGQAYTLPAYAAAFLGATTARPVRFNVVGTVLGVLVLCVGVSGLTMLGAPIWVPNVFNALALIAALLIARLLAGRAG